MRGGAGLVAVATMVAPVLLGGGLLAAPLLGQPQWLITYAPLAPAVLLSLAAAGAWRLSRPVSHDPDDRTWAVASLTLWVLAALIAVGFATAQLALPGGEWEALARPRGVLALLAAWALSERLDQVHRRLGIKASSTPNTVLDDAASLTLLLGVPLMARSLVPSLPPARDLMGPLARPIMLLLLVGVMVGVARLVHQLLLVARSGEARDL